MVSLRKYKQELKCLFFGVWLFHTLAVDLRRWGTGNHKIYERVNYFLIHIKSFMQHYLLNTNYGLDAGMGFLR